jgi:hypothetical protein
MQDHDCHFARILVLGKAIAGDHADHDQTEPSRSLPELRPLRCFHRVGGQTTALETKRPWAAKGDLVDSVSDLRLTCQLCGAAVSVLDRGSMGDARAYKTAIVNTTYQRLSCCTFTLVTAGFSR